MMLFVNDNPFSPVRVVHLVRHGRTRWNVEHRVMGRLEEGIEPAAVDHAWATAQALADDVDTYGQITTVITSPMRRARETASPLVELLNIEPTPDERAGELHVGPWEGLTEDEIAQRWPQAWQLWRTAPHLLELEGRETLPAFNRRVAALLDELTISHEHTDDASGAAVIVTHDAVVRAAVAWALGTGPEIYRHVEVANCSITSVRVADQTRRLLRANQIAHLDRTRH